MKSREIEKIKNDLMQCLDSLSENASETLGRWANTSEGHSDLIDQANFQQEMHFAFVRLVREGLNKNKIQNALQKIEQGRYGICEGCEEEISTTRLKAIPDATYCFRCQAQLEREKRWAIA